MWPDQWLREEGPTKDISEFERQTGFLVERNEDLRGAMNAGVCLRRSRDRAATHSPDLLTSTSLDPSVYELLEPFQSPAPLPVLLYLLAVSVHFIVYFSIS